MSIKFAMQATLCLGSIGIFRSVVVAQSQNMPVYVNVVVSPDFSSVKLKVENHTARAIRIKDGDYGVAERIQKVTSRFLSSRCLVRGFGSEDHYTVTVPGDPSMTAKINPTPTPSSTPKADLILEANQSATLGDTFFEEPCDDNTKLVGTAIIGKVAWAFADAVPTAKTTTETEVKLSR